MRELPSKKGYRDHLNTIKARIKEVEHFTTNYAPSYESKGGTKIGEKKHKNIACVVLDTGEVFVATSKQNNKDQHNKSLAHEVAVGRAMKAARYYLDPSRTPVVPPSFEAPTDLGGIELRDYCRKKIFG